MQQHLVTRALAWPFLSLILATGCAKHAPPANSPEPTAAAAMTPEPAGPPSGPPATADAVPSSSTPDLVAPPEDTSSHSLRSLDMNGSSSKVDPQVSTIPSLPAKIDAPPHAGVDAAVKAVPNNIPVGHLSRDMLEAPLRDRVKFERCRIPQGTRVEIAAVVYNGGAAGVDVHSKPNDRALNFCIERVVRQMTWVKELAVNKVSVAF